MKQRGKFLTFMVVLAALGYVQSLFYVSNSSLLQQTYGTVPVWYPVFLLIGLAAGAAAMVGIWQMKKWGVYLLAVMTVLALLTQLFVLKPVQYGSATLYMALFSAGLWALAIYRKWTNFV